MKFPIKDSIVIHNRSVMVSAKWIVFLVFIISSLTLTIIFLIVQNTRQKSELIMAKNIYDLTINNQSVQPKDSEIANRLAILESVFSNLNFPPSLNKASFFGWKTTRDGTFTFMYPYDWGIGTKCEGEYRDGYIGLGPSLYDFSASNCGSANTPAHIEFYYVTNIEEPENYRVITRNNIQIDGIESYSTIYVIRDRNKAGPTLFNEVVMPRNNKYLIIRLGSEANFINYKNTFDKILSTIDFN